MWSRPVHYVTAATPDHYAEHAARLADDMARWGYELEVVELEPRVRWERSASQKSLIMAERLAQHGRVCWLDADARVHAPLVLIDELPDDVSMAAHWRDGTELLSGTLVLSGDRGRQIAAAWVEAVNHQPDMWDQKMLAAVWPMVHGAVVRVLPPSYCWIAEFMSPLCPRSDVVVEHLQASRQTRAAQGAM